MRWIRSSILTTARVFLALPLILGAGFSQGRQLAQDKDWKKLFDGKSLHSWRVTNFGGEGDVAVEEGQIVLAMGSDLTGITWVEEFPSVSYEVTLEARRLAGNDFFCGLTFPVDKSPCSLIVGGWGGTVVGLSSIDGRDASENETGQLMNFEQGQWYLIRLRVTALKIEAWIDQKKVIDLATAHHKISIRAEVELSRPFGIASWRTKAALREIKLRRIESEP